MEHIKNYTNYTKSCTEYIHADEHTATRNKQDKTKCYKDVKITYAEINMPRHSRNCSDTHEEKTNPLQQTMHKAHKGAPRH